MDMLLNPLNRWRRLRDDIPVMPGAFPLVGHLPAIVCDLPRLLRRAERTLGSHFWLDFGPAGHLMTCLDPDALALLRHKEVSSALIEEMAPDILGGTLVTLDGSAHRQARDGIKAAFLPRGLTEAGIGELFEPIIRAQVKAWRDRGEVAILPDTRNLMLKLTFSLMGIPAQDLSEWHRKYRQLLQLMVAPPIDLPGMPLRRGRAARDWIDAQSRQFIRDARARAARTGLINDMVSAFDCSDGALSDDVLVANIRLLLLAGHETSASTIAWMVIELAQHPELWDALVEEAQRVGAVPTGHEDLAQCPVAEALFRETLRMHPASSLVPRRAMQELQLGQRRIPSGTHLCIPLLHFSTSPLLHEAPDQFRLGRWLQRTEPIRPVDMLQFGAGPHVCMGYHLVWLELVQFSIALALTMQEAGVRPRLMSGVEKGRRYYPTAHPSMTVRIGFS
ncbi:cytochrome P450 protein (plasmid) [Rhizobium phaseoli]|uniref:Cytochrome P450 monooxygenase protein n=2 Tax=Rhizobium TaxID=379 RepID=Q8KLD6_RHIEC|nr:MULTISPECIES: cytochrome P450 [Rhizobium]KEC70660.1 cytochrome P450 monooxygenase [Rhizobium leguminosarum bv. phaseoli CCGM1]UWU38749.1 cytochrome P450 [Rhizobium leguminosarum bv. phaseoli]AAM54804.1 cytochrome P450 monooxygenase protein [Rhizobium etli CFN 42]ANK88532.1 cytochrome P450 protein [Rhizobium sp. N731]ANL18783.1 cytochrome P450 protein [Rhizobium sp. N1314]